MKKTNAVLLTSSAASKLRELQSECSQSYLRVGIEFVDDTGGFEYRIKMSDEVRSNDMIGESEGISILVDETSEPYLQGTTIDWPPDGRGFQFLNPHHFKP